MTITSLRRSRSPLAYSRKDARNAIYTAMYGKGSRVASHVPPAYDHNRKHLNPASVDWLAVKHTLERCWLTACFDEITANKIVSDFNHYAKGSIILNRRELES